MSSYMHMGFNTESLIGERDLDLFSGIILSPVNREPQQLKNSIDRFNQQKGYDIVLDPQLYYPQGHIGYLKSQPYFPSDITTADLGDANWWKNVTNILASYAVELNVNAVASPVMCPKVHNDEYLASCVATAQILKEALSETRIRVLTTVLIDLSMISSPEEVLKIASIVSANDGDGYYLVIESTTQPRREYSDANDLFSIMALIRELENSGKPVLVSHCSSDMLLFKAAGASYCASGKFFNLRRFTKSRYSEPAEGGGQLPYWFEHSLLAFLREADILRLIGSDCNALVGQGDSRNHWGQLIENNLTTGRNQPWLKWGWRQFLSWFSKVEYLLDNESDPAGKVDVWLKEAENNWILTEDIPIIMEEPRNNGSWLRPWRQALALFNKIQES